MKLSLPMDLQFFAEDKAGEEKPVNKNGDKVDDTQSKPLKQEKTFTQEQLDEIVKERLERERKKNEAQVAEAKKLAKMNADQKRDYEAEQVKKRAEAAEAKLARFEMQHEARSMFKDAEVNITDEDLALVVTSDADTTKQKVNQLADFAGRIREEVKNELLKGTTPKATGGVIKGKVSQEKFNQMTLFQRSKLAADDPELFKKLTGVK